MNKTSGVKSFVYEAYLIRSRLYHYKHTILVFIYLTELNLSNTATSHVCSNTAHMYAFQKPLFAHNTQIKFSQSASNCTLLLSSFPPFQIPVLLQILNTINSGVLLDYLPPTGRYKRFFFSSTNSCVSTTHLAIKLHTFHD